MRRVRGREAFEACMGHRCPRCGAWLVTTVHRRDGKPYMLTATCHRCQIVYVVYV